MSWLRRLETKSTAAGDPFFPLTIRPDTTMMPLEAFAYGTLVRGGIDSNVVMAPIQWIMRALAEAPPVVERQLGPDQPWKTQRDHPLRQLLAVPNEWYDGTNLIQATGMSYTLDGNAYLIKRRNAYGAVRELWYAPHFSIFPQWHIGAPDSRFIDRYLYAPMGGTPEILAPSEVVHLRFGLDPRNPRFGMSQLKTLMREIFTDEEAKGC